MDTAPAASGATVVSAMETYPEEDAGAGSQHKFRWQHHCTAVDAMLMLTDPTVDRIVCEIHEDYVVDRAGRSELVSCKTRGANSGPWSLLEICHRGGLAHLFSRWLNLPNTTARLVTNAGLKTGPLEAVALKQACAAAADGNGLPDQYFPVRDAFARALLAARRKKKLAGIPLTEKPSGRQRQNLIPLPAGFTELVEKFMSVVRIKPALPSPDYIRSHHLDRVSVPILRKLQRDVSAAGPCYDAIVSMVTERNMLTPLTADYSTWLTDINSGSARNDLAALVSARSITKDDVNRLINRESGAPPLRRWKTTAPDRLRAKLMAGGIRETRISSAIRLREGWLSSWASLRSDLPGDRAAREDIETRVLDIAGEIEAEVAAADSDWGDKMYEGLRARFKATPLLTSNGIALSGEHLLGAALELASDCEVWFSDPFDVEEALAATSGPAQSKVIVENE